MLQPSDKNPIVIHLDVTVSVMQHKRACLREMGVQKRVFFGSLGGLCNELFFIRLLFYKKPVDL